MTDGRQDPQWVARVLALAAAWRRSGHDTDELRLHAGLREVATDHRATIAAQSQLILTLLTARGDSRLTAVVQPLLDADTTPAEWQLLAERVDEQLARGDSGSEANAGGTMTVGALLEELLTRLQLASELPELHQIDETLLAELRAFLASQGRDAASGSLENLLDRDRRLEAELRRARELSLTDEGTELPNRRAFTQALAAEVGRCERDATVFCLALIDLDDFKAVNDRYGHALGDAMLRCYASEVLSAFRAQDTVARYGGEEFAILLPGTAMDGARKALSKVRERVHRQSVQWRGSELALPTFSGGIVQFEPGESVDRLIERADRLMYDAKRLGKDRIEVDTTAHIHAVPAGTGPGIPGGGA